MWMWQCGSCGCGSVAHVGVAGWLMWVWQCGSCGCNSVAHVDVAAFAQVFFWNKRQYQWRMCLKGYSRCVGRAEQCGRFVCVRSSSDECCWAGNIAQFVWSGSARRGCLCSTEKMEKHLSWHMCCAFSFVIWGCGGVGNGNVVERGCGWWVDAPEHCTCAVIYACSYVHVALVCVMVHLFSGF